MSWGSCNKVQPWWLKRTDFGLLTGLKARSPRSRLPQEAPGEGPSSSASSWWPQASLGCGHSALISASPMCVYLCKALCPSKTTVTDTGLGLQHIFLGRPNQPTTKRVCEPGLNKDPERTCAPGLGRPHPSGILGISCCRKIAPITIPVVTFPILAVTELGAPGSDLSELSLGMSTQG